MNLEEKSLEVRKVFDEFTLESQQFLEGSQLTCLSGCGFCCANPKVPATVLEFLPFALDMYQQGKAEQVLDLVESKTENDFCIIYKATSEDGEKGFCSDYKNRGLICRVFSSSSRTNKEGNKEIITCKKIKEAKKDLYEKAMVSINNGELGVPSSSGYYTRLSNIDYALTKDSMPVNQAIKKALELVLTHKFYESQSSEAGEENF